MNDLCAGVLVNEQLNGKFNFLVDLLENIEQSVDSIRTDLVFL